MNALNPTASPAPAPATPGTTGATGTRGTAAVAGASPGASEQGATPQSLDDAARRINEAVRRLASSLEFSVDETTGRTVVKVMDTATDTVIRQIPTEEVLSIARTLDRLQGLIIRQEA